MPVALVTGAGSGIGRATALALAAKGYSLALAGRTASTLESAAQEVRSAGFSLPSPPQPPAAIFVADVSNAAAVENMIAQVAQQFGRIDLLINNAGTAPAIPLAKMSVEQWQEVLATNLSSAFFTTRAVWPIMERQHAATKSSGGGVIINISSRAARDPFPGLGAYAAAKLAVNMLTLVSAREGAPVGIRAYAIAPGAVETAMFRKLADEQAVPSDTILRPEDVAAAIVECAGGSLRYASGETIFLHHGPA